jgi:hypothetical protein
MLFGNKIKPTVGYYLRDEYIPMSMLNDVEKYQVNTVGCPSVSYMSNKIYTLKSWITAEIKFGINNLGKEYYEYNYDTTQFAVDSEVHRVMKDALSISKDKNGNAVLQVLYPIYYVTDDKDVEISTIPESTVGLDNCKYLLGSFNIYGWIRDINVSFIQLDNTKLATIYLNFNKPVMNIVFNKAVNLKKIEPNKKILQYKKNMYEITKYFKKIDKHYLRLLAKRPKKLL